MDPADTQAQQPEAETPAPEAEQQTTIPKQRFDEVYRERSEAQRRAEQAEQSVMQLTSQVAQLMETMSRAQQPVVPEAPIPDIDPEQARAFEYVAKKSYGGKLDTLERTLNQLTQNVAALTNQFGENQLSTRDNIPSDVMTEAKKLVATGFGNLENSVNWVLGKKWREQQVAAAKQGARNRMNGQGGTNTLPFGSGTQGQYTNATLNQKPLPPNFARMSGQEQLKALRAAMPGVEDAPL